MALLDIQIESLTGKVKKIDDARESTQNILDSLKKIKSLNPDSIQHIRLSKKIEFDLNKEKLRVLTDSLIIKNINSSYQTAKIKKLESYYLFFKTYKIILLSVGILLIIIGFRYWIGSVYRDELVKDKDVNPNYKSSFIRHLQFCRPYFIKKNYNRFFLLIDYNRFNYNYIKHLIDPTKPP